MSREPISYGSPQWSEYGTVFHRTACRTRSPSPIRHSASQPPDVLNDNGRLVGASGFLSGSRALLHCKSCRAACGSRSSPPAAARHEDVDTHIGPGSQPAPSGASGFPMPDRDRTDTCGQLVLEAGGLINLDYGHFDRHLPPYADRRANSRYAPQLDKTFPIAAADPFTLNTRVDRPDWITNRSFAAAMRFARSSASSPKVREPPVSILRHI